MAILETKENEINLIDISLVENIRKLISIKKDEESNNETIKKLNSEINEFKRLQLSKDNEISKVNELLLTKKNEIISLNKIIEEQKNGSREKEIEENYKKEKEKLLNKINDLEIRIYNINEEKNNLIKLQNIIKNQNEELSKEIKEKEVPKDENLKYNHNFNKNDIKIINNINFAIEKISEKEKDTIEDIKKLQNSEEKEE